VACWLSSIGRRRIKWQRDVQIFGCGGDCQDCDLDLQPKNRFTNAVATQPEGRGDRFIAGFRAAFYAGLS
jgi:hypothetical protein